MFKPLTVLLVFACASITGLAQDVPASSPTIVTNSPFLPPGFSPPGGAGAASDLPAAPGQYEFRGVYKLGGIYYFNLFNKRENKGSWVNENSTADDLPRIIRYDLEEDLLVVDVAGEQSSLSLIETSNRPMALVSSRPATPQTKPATPATTSPRATTNTPTRRRVIRPVTRTQAADAAARRPVNQPNP